MANKKKRKKKTDNDLHNTMHKTKDLATRTLQKKTTPTLASKEQTVPAPLQILTVLLLLKIQW